jgi:UDPglucose--hexose-1-phosphate uridylyltransferase
MPQVRVDPLTGLKTIIAGERADRPGGGFAAHPPEPIDTALDPFSPGNEHETPPELHAVRDDGGAPDTPGWSVRVVPNRYPALDPQATRPPADAHPDLFTAQPAAGAHEVIVNAAEAVSSLSDLTAGQLALAVEVWRARMRASTVRPK